MDAEKSLRLLAGLLEEAYRQMEQYKTLWLEAVRRETMREGAREDD